MNSFNRLHHMYEEELYSNASALAHFYLTNPSFFNLTTEELFGVYVLNGNR